MFPTPFTVWCAPTRGSQKEFAFSLCGGFGGAFGGELGFAVLEAGTVEGLNQGSIVTPGCSS